MYNVQCFSKSIEHCISGANTIIYLTLEFRVILQYQSIHFQNLVLLTFRPSWTRVAILSTAIATHFIRHLWSNFIFVWPKIGDVYNEVRTSAGLGNQYLSVRLIWVFFTCMILVSLKCNENAIPGNTIVKISYIVLYQN